VDPKYVPEGFTFKEPSKLSKIEALDRLKFWYDRQQNPKVNKIFQFRRILGRTGEPEELPDAVRKQKKPSRKQPARDRNKQTGPKPPGSHAAEDDEQSHDSSDSASDPSEAEGEDERGDETDEEPDPLPKKKRGRPPHKVPVRPDSDAEENARGGEGEDEDEQEQDHPPRRGRGRPPLKAPKPLPFAAVRIGPKRRVPATGPQFERPATRHLKRKAEEEHDGGPSKKEKMDKLVTKIGPPRGQPKDKPAGGRGKGKVGK
jgi:hypothetical protein